MTVGSRYSSVAAAQAGAATEDHEMSTVIFAIALACGIWYFFILLVQIIGTTQLYRYYSSRPEPATSSNLKLKDVPHITILRPVKGLEPQLYECLASTFRQSYPSEKLTIYLCVASRSDPAFPVLQRLVGDFPKFDAKIFIEEEDPNLTGGAGSSSNLGPNPKIRNMSRGYREAKGDIIWIIDCNVWIGQGVSGRMVDKLCGYSKDSKKVTPYKFVHQLPLVVDSVDLRAREESRGLLEGHDDGHQVSSTRSSAYEISAPSDNESRGTRGLRIGGGRLEEMFMACSHAKFYTAINTVGVAPCIVGKSTMFRKSHLDYLTPKNSSFPPGIDFFSNMICEDHAIGDLLWRRKVEEEASGQVFYKHGLVFGDLAIQPMAGMSVQEYIARRVRWLRVRKWFVLLATLVEPGVEPLLCSAYGAFAFSTLPCFYTYFHVSQTWKTFFLFWSTSVFFWLLLDSFVYAKLHSGSSIELDSDTPSFARPQSGDRRPLIEWLSAWMGRELLALPIWTWACLCGTTVVWRGKTFRVGYDMKVVEVRTEKKGIATPEIENARSRSKDRLD